MTQFKNGDIVIVTGIRDEHCNIKDFNPIGKIVQNKVTLYHYLDLDLVLVLLTAKDPYTESKYPFPLIPFRDSTNNIIDYSGERYLKFNLYVDRKDIRKIKQLV